MKYLSCLILSLLFFICACSGEKTAKDSIFVIEEAGPAPDWIAKGIKVSRDGNDQKNILMVCYGKGPKKEIARSLSVLHCGNYVSSYFHKIILQEFEKMMADADINKKAQEKFKSSEILTGKINVSGMILLKSWWRNVSKSFSDPNKNSETYFEFYGLFSLPYSRFVEIIEEVKLQTVIKKNGTTLTQEQINSLNHKLNELKDTGERLLSAQLVLGKTD